MRNVLPQQAAKKRFRQHRLAARLCVNCATPLVSGDKQQQCPACRSKGVEATQQRRLRYREEGRCIHCGGDSPIQRDNAEQICVTCYLRACSREHFGTNAQWPMLLAAWERCGGICPYTGLTMRLGIDASVEHRYPSSRFPALRENPQNIEWIHLRVNEMKRDFTHDEFIAFIRGILSYVDNTAFGEPTALAAASNREPHTL